MPRNRICNRRPMLPAVLIVAFCCTLAGEANAKGGIFHKQRGRHATTTACRGGACQKQGRAVYSVPRPVTPTYLAPVVAYSAPAPAVAPVPWAYQPQPQRQGACQGGQCQRR